MSSLPRCNGERRLVGTTRPVACTLATTSATAAWNCGSVARSVPLLSKTISPACWTKWSSITRWALAASPGAISVSGSVFVSNM